LLQILVGVDEGPGERVGHELPIRDHATLFNGYATDGVYKRVEDLSNGALWWCIAHLYKSILLPCYLCVMDYEILHMYLEFP
jgi:hypothetical protein